MKIRKDLRGVLCLSLLIILLLQTLLCSCGVVSVLDAPNDDETTAPKTETEAPPALNVVQNEYGADVEKFMGDLSGGKYGGVSARIVAPKKNMILPDETQSKVISEDMVERNLAVEDTLGIVLTCEERDPDLIYSELRSAKNSGTYYADCVMYPQNMIGSFVTGGAVINMKGLPSFETDKDYYYQSAVAAGTGGDAVYAVAGPASLNEDGLSCIYFNKAMIEKAGLESPYALVDRGEWTIDKYIEYVKAGGALEGEYYGYGAQNTQTYLTDLFYFAGGETLTVSDLGSYPALNMGGQNVVPLIEKIREATVNAESSGSAVLAIDAFNSGNTLFLIDRLDTMKSLVNSKTDWGILPMPKFSKDQAKYLSLANCEDAMFFSAVATAPNYAMSADLIAALNIMSYGYTQDAYVAEATYYYLRDNESIRMLDHIVKNPVFDMAYSFSGTYNAIPSATFMAVRNAVAGVSTLERYIGMWQGQFSNAMYYLFDVND